MFICFNNLDNRIIYVQYCKPNLFGIYNNWTNATEVKFNYEGRFWTVGICMNGRSCRFGNGWDTFIEENHITKGKKMHFQYLHPLTFEVSQAP